MIEITLSDPELSKKQANSGEKCIFLAYMILVFNQLGWKVLEFILLPY